MVSPEPGGQNEIMIAAVALSLGNTTVVTIIRDLTAVRGLTVERWADIP
jgi:predicted nucleic acid-binding protein